MALRIFPFFIFRHIQAIFIGYWKQHVSKILAFLMFLSWLINRPPNLQLGHFFNSCHLWTSWMWLILFIYNCIPFLSLSVNVTDKSCYIKIRVSRNWHILYANLIFLVCPLHVLFFYWYVLVNIRATLGNSSFLVSGLSKNRVGRSAKKNLPKKKILNFLFSGILSFISIFRN